MVVFPAGGGIAGFVYWVLNGIMSWGWVSYGFAIFFFTLLIKLIMSPLDFANRYFSRKNQIATQAIAAELKDLEQTYGNDPLVFARKRQELLRKNGAGGLGGSLVTLVSLILTLVIFFQVLGALNNTAKLNIWHEYEELKAVYQDCQEQGVDAETLHDRLNQAYQQNKTGFFWVKNIWQPDTFWTSSVMSFDEFNKSQPADHRLDESERETYQAIYQQIDKSHKGGNGWLLLVLLVGAANFVSMKLSQLAAARRAPAKQAAAQPKEEIITYSLRDAKKQQTAQPSIDPAQMNKMLQFIMPVVLIIFAVNQSAAFAIYMIASSLISTLLTILFSFLIDAILKRQKPGAGQNQEFDASVINPHAKYFKGGRKS